MKILLFQPFSCVKLRPQERVSEDRVPPWYNYDLTHSYYWYECLGNGICCLFTMASEFEFQSRCTSLSTPVVRNDDLKPEPVSGPPVETFLGVTYSRIHLSMYSRYFTPQCAPLIWSCDYCFVDNIYQMRQRKSEAMMGVFSLGHSKD